MDEDKTVECPCCHGNKVLWQHDADRPGAAPYPIRCTHCQGHGRIRMDMMAMVESLHD